ncbi:hypothetical protein BJ742DRAFT_772815 [Cladochytrium replicatum]|nr:hypothetical protein BJ742DRAFT_772815 [Cladochytrium replicatum]
MPDKGPEFGPKKVLGCFRHRFAHRMDYLRVDEDPDSSEYPPPPPPTSPLTTPNQVQSRYRQRANEYQSSDERAKVSVIKGPGFWLSFRHGEAKEKKRDWKMDDREDTIAGKVLYKKLWFTFLNIYSGYFYPMMRLIKFIISFFHKSSDHIQNDEKGKSNQRDRIKPSRKRYGTIPRGSEGSYTEEDLRARNRLWKTLMAASFQGDNSIPELDRKNLLYQQGIYGDNIYLVACLLMYTPNKFTDNNENSQNVSNYEKYARVVAYLLTRENHRRAFINSQYEGKEYLGETAMHAMVVHDDLVMLRKLWEYGADLEFSRAKGVFFERGGTVYYGQSLLGFAVCLGRTRIVEFLLKEANVDPNSFDMYGNTALHMLCWWGLCEDESGNLMGLDQPKTEKQKKPESDERGSSMYMGHSFDDMNTRLGSLWTTLVQYGANPSFRNFQNLTPFLVAVHRGNVHMVWAIIEDSKLIVWNFGRVVGYRYPLTNIDFHKPSDKTENLWSEYDPRKKQSKIDLRKRLKEEREYFTALELAVHNRDAAMIAKIPLFRIVLEAKWIIYAKDMFLWYLSWFIVYQGLFLAAQSITPLGRDNASDRRNYESNRNARLALDILLVLANLHCVAEEIRELMLLQFDLFVYFNVWADGVLNLLQLLNVIMFTFVVAFRFAGLRDEAHSDFFSDAEMHSLTALNLISWLPLFYYFQGFQVLGPLIAAISRMRWMVDRNNLTQSQTPFEKAGVGNLDVLPPIFIDYANATSVATYIVAAMNQTQHFVNSALKVLNTTLNEEDESRINASDKRFGQWWFPGTAAWSLGVMLQTVERFDDLEGAENEYFVYLLLLFYTALTVYILVNVLIAMMNQTYSGVADESAKIWRIQWASIVLAMDRKIVSDMRMEEWSLGDFLPTVYPTVSGELASMNDTQDPSEIIRDMLNKPEDPSSKIGLRYNAMGEMTGLARYITMQVRADWTIMKLLFYESDVDYYGYARGESGELNGPLAKVFSAKFLSFVRVLFECLFFQDVPAIDVGEKIREFSEVRWDAPGTSLPNTIRNQKGTVGRRGE